MRHALSAKLEIDVLQARELEEAIELATVHCMPAIVIHQDLAQHAYISRGRRQGKFKIIVQIDWPKGNVAGSAKFQDCPTSVLHQDGFEIMLSPAKSDSHALKELQAISTLVRTIINPSAELRFCLDALTRTEAEWTPYCKMMSKVVAPDFLRIDHNVSLQQSKANLNTQTDTMAKIESLTPRRIKLSGNLTSVKTIAKLKAARFGVSLKQAKDILQELKENPELANDRSDSETLPAAV